MEQLELPLDLTEDSEHDIWSAAPRDGTTP